jgi:hypothetical protein
MNQMNNNNNNTYQQLPESVTVPVATPLAAVVVRKR